MSDEKKFDKGPPVPRLIRELAQQVTQSSYEVENPEIKALLQDIGHMLAEKMPKGWGFTLCIFSYGEGGAMFYLSSANREHMRKSLIELVEKLQGGRQ